MIYTGDRFPQWRGNLFVGGMVGQQLARLTLQGQRVVSEETLVPQMGRIRDVRQGPDGYIYLVTDDRDGKPTPMLSDGAGRTHHAAAVDFTRESCARGTASAVPRSTQSPSPGPLPQFCPGIIHVKTYACSITITPMIAASTTLCQKTNRRIRPS